MSLWLAYLMWPFLMVGLVAALRALNSPVGAYIGIWFLMMTWECYDLHPDHVLAYSVVLFAGAFLKIHDLSITVARIHSKTG